MGRIFTWEQVLEGEVPKMESFEMVISQLRSRLVGQSAIVGALLCGSAVRGDFNLRSDVDCVVLYKTNEEKAAMATMQDMTFLASALHVPVHFLPCDTVLSRTRLHHFGQSFTEHLQVSIEAGGMIKGDFVKSFATTIPSKQEIESYIMMKMYKMQESMSNRNSLSEEQFFHFLTKAIEAPIHVARKMLTYEGTLLGDSKKRVLARYCETMPQNFAELLDRLVRVDALYTAKLKIQINNPNEGRYFAIITKIQDELPSLLEFLRLNILRLNGATR